MNNLDHMLGRVQAGQKLLSHCPFLDPGYEVFNNLKVYIGFKQGQTHFTQGFIHIRLGQTALAP
jgi:hypothetical protein